MSNQKNYDAEFCGSLAIHQTNSIQDFGYLIVAEKEQLKIVQGSENLEDIMPHPIKNSIGTPLSDYLNEHDFAVLLREVNKGERNRIPFQFDFHNGDVAIPLNLLVHVKEKFVIIEIELKGDDEERSFTEVFNEVRSFISTLENNDDVQQICTSSIAEIRRIGGFDGIRMYTFDQDWNGTVIAEEITGELESYLGQTFPASDVPKQARALYLKNPYRLIPDRNYKTVKLYPVINPITNGFLDLSDCNLRSVAGVHLEYMANMNVVASMSIRIILDGQLWALISCHHTQKKYLSIERRSIFEWLSMEISYRLTAVSKHEQLTFKTEKLQQKAEIIENIYQKNDLLAGLFEGANENICSLFDISGYAVMLNGRTQHYGHVPDPDALENLFLWLDAKNMGDVFSTHCLSHNYAEAEAYQQLASGLLVIPINAKKGDYMIGFRPEFIQHIKWGGDPGSAINFEKDGITYHPRNSFKVWLQTVFGQSVRWSQTDLEMAELLRSFLFEFRSKQLYN